MFKINKKTKMDAGTRRLNAVRTFCLLTLYAGHGACVSWLPDHYSSRTTTQRLLVSVAKLCMCFRFRWSG